MATAVQHSLSLTDGFYCLTQATMRRGCPRSRPPLGLCSSQQLPARTVSRHRAGQQRAGFLLLFPLFLSIFTTLSMDSHAEPRRCCRGQVPPARPRSATWCHGRRPPPPPTRAPRPPQRPPVTLSCLPVTPSDLLSGSQRPPVTPILPPSNPQGPPALLPAPCSKTHSLAPRDTSRRAELPLRFVPFSSAQCSPVCPPLDLPSDSHPAWPHQPLAHSVPQYCPTNPQNPSRERDLGGSAALAARRALLTQAAAAYQR